MKHNSRLLAVLVQLVLILYVGWAQAAQLPPDEPAALAVYLGPTLHGRLLAQQPLSRIGTRQAPLQLAPQHPSFLDANSTETSGGSGILVETLAFSPYPGSSPLPIMAIRRLAAYNTLRAVGSMQGIEYYSVTHQKNRVLYESSFLINGPADAVRLPDSWQPSVPTHERVYASQKDTTFGQNLYRIDITALSDGFLYEITNETALRYALVPLAAKRATRVRVLLILAREGILFHTVSEADIVQVPGLRSRIEESFANRSSALFSWFVSNFAQNLETARQGTAQD